MRKLAHLLALRPTCGPKSRDATPRVPGIGCYGCLPFGPVLVTAPVNHDLFPAGLLSVSRPKHV
jgi:hypothetical protein